MSNVIEVKNINKSYGKNKVLNDITFNLREGELLGLLGPSGCGKTTIIKTILGITNENSGKRKILGEDKITLDVLSQIGYMAQESALYDYLTGRQHLKFFGEIYSIKKDELKKRIKDLGELTELTFDLDKKVKNYSGGMKKRLAFAIALINKPKILILDEPTVGIDPILREKIWVELLDLCKKGTSILITTHVMDEVFRCNNLILMREGNILVQDSPIKVLENVNAKTMEEAFLYYIKGR